ncbi:uncharacterized protein K452DRAFT_280495 [Aplosporella prunicola CBS 121167]|uniref:Spindle pole body component n=1 Tax=Aplosporella prunicola CBS 121167 TaxID=1176127 RepID=A0A6A6AVR7_9PEZI|nr:uncharacterized protein K452DRAFT_280495 [Aplosporella prunicola CBS 121167]KAF2136102.1 hypothetical protein K452DRAFT_280495 [Aplosporella prunicola CBS 121167]
MNIDEDLDAFAVRDLWRSSSLALPDLEASSTLFPNIELDITAIKLDNPYAPSKDLEHDLRLPDLETFQYGVLEDLDSGQESTVSSAAPQQPPENEVKDKDVWDTVADLAPAHQDIRFQSWEAFGKPGYQEPSHTYVGEAGPEAFDVAVAQQQDEEKSKGSGRIIRADILLQSLYNLGLGRSSALFRFDAQSQAFAQAIEDGRMSGFSLESAQSLINNFIQGGATVRYLRNMVEKTYVTSNAFPARVALANAIGAILSALENHLGNQATSVNSLLQLQDLFERPHRILSLLREMVEAVRTTRSNEELVTQLYIRVQDMDQGDNWLRSLFLEILSKVTNPWIQFAAGWAGLRHGFDAKFGKKELKNSFADIDEASEDQTESSKRVEHIYRPENMPIFITDEDGRMIFETGKSLRFLEKHHGGHPLCAPHSSGVHAPPLEWKFDWEVMENVAAKAKDYERSLVDAIHKFGQKTQDAAMGEHSELEIKKLLSEPQLTDTEKYFQDTAKLFDQAPTTEEAGASAILHRLVVDCISVKAADDENAFTFAPPLSVTPSLSLTPLFMAQARLVNATTLRLFFRSHGLRLHLAVQRQYHLLGDGVFMSRLTSALFSPELETAERKRGTVRTGAPMGLKLGSRSTWPPASSELRLALMGVLSETYHSSELYQTYKNDPSVKAQHEVGIRETPDLPGNLSFAIRTLPSADIEKVMDPNSLHALDFLRLQYTAPPPLHLVITPSALDKYDQCFKHLLRISRMLFVVSHQLPRHGLPGVPESHSLRAEAHHFVTSIAAYFFDSGIRETWAAFAAWLDELERRLAAEDARGELGTRVTEGLESVRAAHDACLERMLFALLLRRRQAQLLALLEDIFEAVLGYAKIAARYEHEHEHEHAVSADDAAAVPALRAAFRSKVQVFMSVCRGLAGKRGYARGQAAAALGGGLFGEKSGVLAEENTIERLLVRLEMSKYYGAQPARGEGD